MQVLVNNQLIDFKSIKTKKTMVRAAAGEKLTFVQRHPTLGKNQTYVHLLAVLRPTSANS